MEKKNVPQLRFKEFEDEWEEKALGECFTERNERSSEGDLISVTINNGIKKAEELERFVHIADKSNYKVVKKGDLAYNTMRMWQGASGYSPYSGILSPAYTVLCPNENTDSLFHSYLFKKPDMIHLFEINSQGLTSDTWNLKYDAFSEIKTNVPSKTEQQKIGSFLSKIDSLIQAKTQKLESLKSVKKSLLQKCFPKDGEKVPQMRFYKVENGKWITERLGDICEINPKSELPAVFEYVDLESVIGTEMLSHRTEQKNSAPSRAQRLAMQGDIFYQTVRPYQKNNYHFKLNSTNFVFSTGYAQIRTNTIDSEYLMYQLQTDYFVNQVLEKCTGTSYPAINSTDLADIQITYPIIESEQRKIGQLFSKYDSLISLQQKEIENLKTIKKSLLQKMFV